MRHLMAVKNAKEKQKICDDYAIDEIRKNKKTRREVEKLR